MLRSSRLLSSILVAWLLFGPSRSVRAAGDEGSQSVVGTAAKISELVARRWASDDIQPAAVSGDLEFIRRIYLDLAGRIPRLDEVKTFLEDKDEDKRRELVFQLTHSQDYARHFADTFDTLLMGRGSDADYESRRKHGWRDFLEAAFRDNRPWNDVVREFVLARPGSPEDRGAVWFLFERENQYQQIAEAVAPAVFGIRVECAQCHDHPIASEIEQAHYWGLVAFFNRGKNVNAGNGPRVSESAIGGFSEFADLTGESRPNRLAFLQASTIEESRPDGDAKQEDSDDLYRPAPIEGEPRVPKFSRRERFAEDVVAGHPLVARAMVNRVWAMLMGRGLVHPFDEMDSAHEPSHPELLDWLTQLYRDTGYDTRRLVQAIVLSQPYQLSSRRPQGQDDPASFAWYLERPLTAEQLTRSFQIAVRNEADDDSRLLREVRSRIVDVMPEENITTVKTALFLTNHESLNDFIQQSVADNHLVPWILNLTDRARQIELLFETVFARQATDEEQSAVERFLDSGRDNEAGWQQIVWSMLTSAEFRFNH